MHLLQAGVDLSVIALWLGHENITTTHQYLEADLGMKEKALACLQPPKVNSTRYKPSCDVLSFLDGLVIMPTLFLTHQHCIMPRVLTGAMFIACEIRCWWSTPHNRELCIIAGTPKGAEASAMLYSLIETAKANKLEPYAYLRHIFEKLPTASTLQDFEALLSWNIDSNQLTSFCYD